MGEHKMKMIDTVETQNISKDMDIRKFFAKWVLGEFKSNSEQCAELLHRNKPAPESN